MTPRTYTLAIPLVLMFFAVFGLRAAFTIPTELDANWVFRLVQPTVRESVRASRWLILLLGVVPIAIVWLLVTLAMWPAQTAHRRDDAVADHRHAADRDRAEQLDQDSIRERPRARDRDAQVEGRRCT